MSKRSVAHHEADARRFLRGRDPDWLRGYIGRHLIRVMMADDMLADQNEARLLGPELRRAMKFLRDLAQDEEA